MRVEMTEHKNEGCAWVSQYLISSFPLVDKSKNILRYTLSLLDKLNIKWNNGL